MYALLTGLNSATVGIIALAAVQLSQKAITDKLSRILVFFGATAGLLYNALWYFPVLMMGAGCAAAIWDTNILQNYARRARRKLKRSHSRDPENNGADGAEMENIGNGPDRAMHQRSSGESTVQGRTNAAQSRLSNEAEDQSSAGTDAERTGNSPSRALGNSRLFSWKVGCTVLVSFFITFIVIMVLRGVLPTSSRGFDLFANLYLAGTVIFGGGPVVIPLLRE